MTRDCFLLAEVCTLSASFETLTLLLLLAIVQYVVCVFDDVIRDTIAVII